jgi:hypothetical protein
LHSRILSAISIIFNLIFDDIHNIITKLLLKNISYSNYLQVFGETNNYKSCTCRVNYTVQKELGKFCEAANRKFHIFIFIDRVETHVPVYELTCAIVYLPRSVWEFIKPRVGQHTSRPHTHPQTSCSCLCGLSNFRFLLGTRPL